MVPRSKPEYTNVQPMLDGPGWARSTAATLVGLIEPVWSAPRPKAGRWTGGLGLMIAGICPLANRRLANDRTGAGPVIETTVRIPSGDARQVVYGALVGGVEATVVEVHNDSPVPVALAMAIRPYDLDGSANTIGPLALDGTTVLIGDRPSLLLPRAPNQSGHLLHSDVLDQLLDGTELTWTSTTADDPRFENAVVLYPLPHRTSLRFVVLTDPDRSATTLADRRVAGSAAPEADAVVRGWNSVVDGAGRFEFPDPGLTALFNGARARLLLEAAALPQRVANQDRGAGLELSALALGGHRSEVAPVLTSLQSSFPTSLPHGPQDAADLVGALGPALDTTQQPPTPELLEVAVQLTQLIEGAGDPASTVRAKRGLARVVRLAGDKPGAKHLDESAAAAPKARSRVGQLFGGRLFGGDPAVEGNGSLSSPGGVGPESAPGVGDVAAIVDSLAEAASATGTWGLHDSITESARFVVAARGLLIDDEGPDLVMLPDFRSSWRGGNVELHEVVTRHGTLSFAIRWHGYRPALLWGLVATDATAPLVTLRCPGLDEGWATTEPSGETLLTGSSEALIDAPMPGDSFQ